MMFFNCVKTYKEKIIILYKYFKKITIISYNINTKTKKGAFCEETIDIDDDIDYIWMW